MKSSRTIASGPLCFDGWAPTSEDERLVAELAGVGPKCILLTYDWIPRADTSGTDLRLMFLLDTLALGGHRVTLFCRQDSATEPDRRRIIEQLGIELIIPPTRGHDEPAVASLLKERKFDLAILFHWYWGDLSVAEQFIAPIRQHSPCTKIVLLVDEFAWARDAQSRSAGRNQLILERARGYYQRDRHLVREVDAVLVLCEEDGERASKMHPGVRVFPCGYGYWPIPDSAPGYDEREGIIFVGAGTNGLNRLMVRWLTREVFPRVRERAPDLTLYLVGIPPEEGWFENGTPPGIVVKGHVPDLHEFLQHRRAMIAPIPFGTGLRSKNVASLCAGLPVATTRAGAEGMGPDRAKVIVEEQNAAGLAEGIVRLCTDRAFWESLAKNALPYAEEHFGRRGLTRDLTAWLQGMNDVVPKSLRAESVPPASRVFATTDMPTATAEDRAQVSYFGRLGHARRLVGQQQLDDAVSELRFLFGDIPGMKADWRGLTPVFALFARCYAGQGDLAEAETSLQEAKIIEPTNPDLLEAELEIASARAAPKDVSSLERTLAEGEQLFATGRKAEALRIFLGAVKTHPESETAWNDLGVVLNAAGYLDDALTALDRAISIRGGYREAHLNRAQVLVKANRQNEAVLALEETLRCWPGDKETTDLLEAVRALSG